MACGIQTPGNRVVPLAPYDGKSNLRVFFVQCIAQGNGWNPDESSVHLVAALYGVAAEVLTTIPDGVVSVPNLIVALKYQFGVEQQSELVKTQLAVRT